MDWRGLPEIEKIIPGALGSLFSMIFIRDSWFRMLSMFFGGVALSYYASSYVAKMTTFPEGFSGFLLGLMGMTLVSSIFAGWKDFKVVPILVEFIRARLKLPPPKDGQQ